MNQTISSESEPNILHKLSKDLKEASATLTPDEVRFLVFSYYRMQENRIRADGQLRALSAAAEPHRVLGWLSENSELLETQIRKALDYYSLSNEVGRWSRTVKGVGPVIAAGLLAHIDITKAPTVGHIWRFAGLDPTSHWQKKEKRPWNAQLKTLCWKIGESFIKVSGYDDAFYGKVYLERKEFEAQHNAQLRYAEQAAVKLKIVGEKTEAFKFYSKGMLPPGHIHARARRYAVKLFLSHWHEIAYQEKFGTSPPKPYPIAILGHAHERKPMLSSEPKILSEPSSEREPLSQSEP